MVPLIAIAEPVPKALPPEATAETSAAALITASSRAVTVTEPAPTVPAALPRTRVLLRNASTSLRTSFLTTRPPSAMALDALTLLPCGIRLLPSTGFQNRRSR